MRELIKERDHINVLCIGNPPVRRGHSVLGMVFLLVLNLLCLCYTTSSHAGWTGIGPNGGPVVMLVIDPKSTQMVYAVTPGGILKSTNGGKNWSAANSGLSAQDVCSLAIDPKNTGPCTQQLPLMVSSKAPTAVKPGAP